MHIVLNTRQDTLTLKKNGKEEELSLYSPEAFAILSEYWLKVGWNARYHYTFTWCGQPVLQLPEDLIRLQEVIWTIRPDVIIETGVALGGSLLFYASLCSAMGKGRVIGVDIDLRPPNRRALEEHPLFSYLTLIEGNSTDATTLHQVKGALSKEEKVVVILDSNHSKKHVLSELENYHPLVSEDSYLIVSDGFKKELSTLPRGKSHWEWDNPADAVIEFLADHPEFVLKSPEREYNRSSIRETVTHFKHAWLYRTPQTPKDKTT